MKSRIFLCLLLMVAMFAFVGCGPDGTDTKGALEQDARDMMNDVERGIDDMTDGMMDNTTDRDLNVNDNNRNDDMITDGTTTDGSLSNY